MYDVMKEYYKLKEYDVAKLLAFKIADLGITANIIYGDHIPTLAEDGIHTRYVANTGIKDLELDFSEYNKRLLQSQWISCKERLPKETGDYLCTVEWYGSSDKENLISSNIEIPRRVMMVHFLASNKSFKECINFCNYKVIAWIPLIETYKGE